MRAEEDFLDHDDRWGVIVNRVRRDYALGTLSRMLNIERDVLWRVLEQGPARYYRRRLQRKTNGGVREILAPIGELRRIQRAIKDRIVRPCHDVCVSPIAHGYVRNRSIVTCAMMHAEAKALFEIDIADAFLSVDAGTVSWLVGSCNPAYKLWGKLPLVITDFLTYNGRSIHRRDGQWRIPARGGLELFIDFRLPQGALTSPMLFNLACRYFLDDRLDQLARKYDCVVTRYSDNIFISRKRPIPWKIRGKFIKAVLFEGFRVAGKKTRYQEARRGRPLTMFGMVINEGEFRLTNTRLRKMRIHLYNACCAERDDRIAGIVNYVVRRTGRFPHQLGQVLLRFGRGLPFPETNDQGQMRLPLI